jgi:uncharacterized protein with von Willebrand factor type A (vWA) domain
MFKNRFFHSCLNTDSYDKYSFERLHEMSPKLQQIRAEGDDLFPGFINLMGDQWASLYKADPQINPEASGKALNHKPLVKRVMQSEEYETLRQSTTLDDFSSALGALSLGENTIEYIRLRKEQDEKLKEQMNLQKSIQNDLDSLQRNIDKRDFEGKNPTKKQEKMKQSLEEQLQQLGQQIGQKLADGLNPGEMLKQIASDTQEAKDSLENLLSGPQAGSGKAEMEKIPLRNQLELAQSLKHQPKIKDVANWAGRFKSIARRKQKSKSTESTERSAITQGNKPELLLPTELMRLKNPSTKLDFYRRFVEGETLQYSTLGKDSMGKGPIVLCLDQSGSMGHIREKAAGFALAIAMIARHQGRDFAYIPFAVMPGEELIAPKGKLSTETIVKIATEFIDGGTNFEKPLHRAAEIIKSKRRFKDADIIFITDGEATVSDTYLKRYLENKKTFGFQCQSCLVGNKSEHIVNILKKFSDEVFIADNLEHAAEESRMFEI